MINSVFACCFTGHRNLPAKKIEKIILNLDREIENLIAKGITDFISGGAIGFDQIAASLIIAKKKMGNAKIKMNYGTRNKKCYTENY
ncbi:MAG: DUF1273 domain-containing protein [Clostridiales bacterium]|nr:DUF1273 domain-containing protein [Clostridiales bacterium]